MSARTLFRLLLVPAAVVSAACDDTSLPQEPSVPVEDSPITQAGAARWASGYLHAGNPTGASYTPLPYLSYNESGGAMNITKPAGTTGRYIVTFNGLSAVLGTKSAVHVTEYGLNDTYCKPVNGRLVEDKLEVRCFRASTGAAANAAFTVVVLGRSSNAAFAYAHQPTATDYAAAAAGSYNPKGGTRVYRSGVGRYTVVFANYASAVPMGNSGHVQMNAVGAGKSYCVPEEWGNASTPNIKVDVACYTPAGLPVDTKFTVLFQLPHPHVAFAFASESTTGSYSPAPGTSWNPSAGSINVTRTAVGDYTVTWSGADPAIIDGGTVQVSSYGETTQCKATSLFDSGAMVHCFGAKGVPHDTDFTVLLGS